MLAMGLRDEWRSAVLAHEALALVGSDGDPALAGLSVSMLGFSAENRGDLDEAEQRFEHSLTIAQAADIPWIVGWQFGNLGRVALVRGEYERATSLLEASLQTLQRIGDHQGESWSYQYLGRVMERQGEPGRAVGLFEAGLAASRDVGDKAGMAWALGNLGRLESKRGNQARATRLLEESLALCRALGDRWGAAWALGSLGRVALAQREYQRATALFEENLVLCQGLANRERRVAYTLQYLGTVASEQGQPERAARLIGAADALREASGRSLSPPDRAEHEHQHLALRRALGEAAFAAAWEAGRALSLDQAIEYALTGSRAPAPGTAVRPPPEPAPSLSPAPAEPNGSPLSVRELEVAVLLARGLTNRQVADALVISERTASTHVSHILNKLGFSARSQVAAWVVEQGYSTTSGLV
jgi:non-specific serine/threonine protein kinase